MNGYTNRRGVGVKRSRHPALSSKDVAWPLFLFRMDGKIRSRWSLSEMTGLQDRDKF
ncbi:MAG: hypothetical protein KAJ52_05595 [Sedimentisphaerales bacterium]|nr:hypothetical protein [Sedimentisphaerales bacterium]